MPDISEILVGVSLDILNNFLSVAECHAYAGISTAVVDSDSSCISVTESSAGEGYVLNIAYTFVILSGVEEVLAAAVLNNPGLVDIEDSGAEAVNIAVAALENAMVEYEPALACFNRNRTCANL